MTTPARPRRRGLYWSAVAVALVALVVGTAVAWVGYRRTAGPDGAVRGYFAALADGDAARALGFGTVPDGPRDLLTAKVLREQQKLAAIRQVDVIATERHGDRATVTVQYRLEFASGPQQAVDTVEVERQGRSWRLARTAVATRIGLTEAVRRASVLGTPVPDDTVLLFPGALPLRFDTPYLELDPGTSSVRLSDGTDTPVDVQVSAAGRKAVTAAVRTALAECLGGGSVDPRCPVPSDRYVPGSLRGRLGPSAVSNLSLTVAPDPNGVIRISGRAIPVTGRYRVLDFENLPVTRSGTVKLPVAAQAVAVAPLRIGWSDPS